LTVKKEKPLISFIKKKVSGNFFSNLLYGFEVSIKSTFYTSSECFEDKNLQGSSWGQPQHHNLSIQVRAKSAKEKHNCYCNWKNYTTGATYLQYFGQFS
jgi:hypothetical protein